jgi:DNA-binding MarR family transcriptional regulator
MSTKKPVASVDTDTPPTDTLRVIQDLLLATKPDAASPVAVSIVVTLLSLKSYGCNYSQRELAAMLGCSVPTIRIALRRLSTLGWITQSQQAGYTKNLTVNIDLLPN